MKRQSLDPQATIHLDLALIAKLLHTIRLQARGLPYRNSTESKMLQLIVSQHERFHQDQTDNPKSPPTARLEDLEATMQMASYARH